MLRIVALLVSVVGFIAPVLMSAPAHAQATRTWVSGAGDDVNPCSRSAPCKTFQAALSRTLINGEVNCLDSGGFGTVTITKPVAIFCNGVVGGILATSGATGVIVNVTSLGKVTLQGLDIEGAGTGAKGIRVIGDAKVIIKYSAIRNFTSNAVEVAGQAGARVLIEDSLFTGNDGGVFVAGAGGAVNAAILIRTTLDDNASFSTSVTAPSLMILNGSTLGGSPNAIINIGGATVSSFGNNYLTGAGLPTAPIMPR